LLWERRICGQTNLTTPLTKDAQAVMRDNGVEEDDRAMRVASVATEVEEIY
jgi:hypothetical protein